MSAARLLLAVSGLIIWSNGFVALYAALSIGCRAGIHRQDLLGTNAMTWLLLAVLLVHVGALGALQLHALGRWRRDRRSEGSRAFLASLGCVVTAASLVAMLTVGFPVLLIPPCV